MVHIQEHYWKEKAAESQRTSCGELVQYYAGIADDTYGIHAILTRRKERQSIVATGRHASGSIRNRHSNTSWPSRRLDVHG